MGSKSAQKTARAAGRKQERNKSVRSQVKTDIATAEKIVGTDAAKAKEAAVKAISALDKAAGKKVVHANNAARRKSRLMKKLNKAAKSAPDTKKAA